MGSVRPRPLILDAGALIALERSDRRVVRLLELAGEINVPAGVVSQVWRNPARQVRLARFLGTDAVVVHGLSFDTAKAVGHLCGASGTNDLIDASVVLLTRQRRGVAVTGDADDLRRIDPRISVVEC